MNSEFRVVCGPVILGYLADHVSYRRAPVNTSLRHLSGDVLRDSRSRVQYLDDASVQVVTRQPVEKDHGFKFAGFMYRTVVP